MNVHDLLEQAERIATVAWLMAWPSSELRYLQVRITDELERRRVTDVRLLDRYAVSS